MSRQEEEDPVGRSLDQFSKSFEDLKAQVQGLRSESRAMKASLNVLSAPGFVPGLEGGIAPESEPGSPTLRKAAEVDFSSNSEAKLLASFQTKMLGAAEDVKEDMRQQFLQHRHAHAHTLLDSASGLSLAAARLGMLAAGTLDAEAKRQEDEQMGAAKHTSFPRRMASWLSVFEDKPVDGDANRFMLITRSPIFKAFVLTAIIWNALYIGWATDNQVRNSFRRHRGDELNNAAIWPDIIFAVCFVIELFIRFAAERQDFLFGEEVYWNIFDIVLIVNSLVELFAPTFMSDFSFLRILRVFRLARVVRVVRSVKVLRALRTMIFSILNSFIALMWALAMMVLIFYLFAIVFCHGVASYFDQYEPNSLDPSKEALLAEAEEYFGNMYSSSVSLFAAITGGNDWMTYGKVLMSLSHDEGDPSGALYFIIFAFYIFFCVIGLLNVVTGIFVDSAVTTRTEDEVVESYMDETQRRREEVRRIFHNADRNHSGVLTFSQFKEHLEKTTVKAYFSGLDIDPHEAAIIFALMDTNGNGSVSVDEFIDGTMKLKGSAKSTDLLVLMFDNVRFCMKFDELCSYVEKEFRSIKKMVGPGTAEHPHALNSLTSP
eukprot:TRINITY_DN30932_c0_g1_i1.p1 TRINITY_DN30932_c0_g1~~TRINITY_DN30932_c0_g1_i1.p1  ORF type:complete len:602 (-),score=120.26 TRINITY_DN30932_c0_g1_i1:131-1936(-)